jgi:FkbM family methyltransferase
LPGKRLLKNYRSENMLKDLLKNMARKAGYRIIKNDFLETYYHSNSSPYYRRSEDINPLEQLFYKYIANDFFFIQIGANNGQRYDPIHHLVVQEKKLVKGIAIEPVDEYFKELQETYKDFPNIKLLNTAIHNVDRESVIYKIAPGYENKGEQLKGMSSFDKNNFLKEGISVNDIVAEKVPCISFMDLVEQENITKLHLLQIDAEGYDIEIINSIDFNRIKPYIINFEHRWKYNLTLESEIFKTLSMLIDNGYKILLDPNDALAYLS